VTCIKIALLFSKIVSHKIGERMNQDQASDQNHASRSQSFHINKSTVIWNESPASRNKKSSLQKFASQRVSREFFKLMIIFFHFL
jgi:hypothetical protein